MLWMLLGKKYTLGRDLDAFELSPMVQAILQSLLLFLFTMFCFVFVVVLFLPFLFVFRFFFPEAVSRCNSFALSSF